MVPKSNGWYPHKKGRFGQRDTDPEGGQPLEDRRRNLSDNIYKPRNARVCWQPLEARKESKKDFSLELSERLWPMPTP